LSAFSFSKDFGGQHFKKIEISCQKERHAGLGWT
jgi:hypothetical protein